jgi:hypothetical protein
MKIRTELVSQPEMGDHGGGSTENNDEQICQIFGPPSIDPACLGSGAGSMFLEDSAG